MTYRVGDLVQITGGWNNEPAFVYETYQDFDDTTKTGASLLTKSGIDLGGFSGREQEKYLTLIKHTNIDYEFKNVIQVFRDWQDGIFDGIFNDL
jgi:hypothetical protein